jgi:hypothetical protein
MTSPPTPAVSLGITSDTAESAVAAIRRWLERMGRERLFCHITQNWRGRPLTDRLAMVELIGATTTKAGLKVECVLDERTYEKGIKVSDAEMRTLNITGDAFHPEWKYSIKPRKS